MDTLLSFKIKNIRWTIINKAVFIFSHICRGSLRLENGRNFKGDCLFDCKSG